MMAPVAKDFRQSGMTEDDPGALVEQERQAICDSDDEALVHCERANHDGHERDDKSHLSAKRLRILRPSAFSKARHPRQP
jgi:hypothetical protein